MHVFQDIWSRFIIFFSSFCCLVFPLTTHAATTDNAWFVGLGGGISWIGLSNSLSVDNNSGFPQPFNHDRFSIHGPASGILQINVGLASNSDARYLPTWSYYLQYRRYFTTDISGQIEQYSLPDFHNYNYQMHYSADLFTLNGKLGLIRLNQLIPYIGGGIGFIINHLSSYSETPLPGVTPRLSPDYRAHTNTNLAVTLGAGLDFLINRCITLTLAYDHVFQGSIQSGSGVGTWSDTSLDFGNTKMDSLFLNITTHYPKL